MARPSATFASPVDQPMGEEDSGTGGAWQGADLLPGTVSGRCVDPEATYTYLLKNSCVCDSHSWAFGHAIASMVGYAWRDSGVLAYGSPSSLACNLNVPELDLTALAAAVQSPTAYAGSAERGTT